MSLACSSCSAALPSDAKFCPVCGGRVAPAAGAHEAPGAATQVDALRAIAGRFIATGGPDDAPTGSLFAATDMQNRGAAVRVLVVRESSLPSPSLVDRALREWRQLAKVTTARIARVIDQGKLDDGKIYVATEPTAGCTLAEVVAKDGPLPLERVRKIVGQIGEALSEAQKVGVIHRDVSPRNIYVDGDQVTVADFGVAEAVTDKVFGAAEYLSPEQAEGKPVDQRSNIYSLGAVIYFMLTGRAPFEGDVKSLLSQHASATPVPPSTRHPGVPTGLDRVVMKALEKSAGRRHLTLRQLVTEVETTSPAAGVVRREDPARAPTLQTEEQARGGVGAATILGMPAALLPREASAVKSAPSAAASAAKTILTEAPVMAAPAPAVTEVPAPASLTPAAPASAAAELAPIVEPRPAPPVAAPAQAGPVVTVKPSAVAAASAKKAGGFRETAWFKKGEIEEEIARAQAAVASEDPLAPVGTTGTHAVYDEAQIDVSSDDKKRLSLRTGATQMMQAVKVGTGGAQALPGERMDEAEMLAEIDRSKRWFAIAGVVVAIAIIAVVVLLATRKGDAPAPSPPKASAPTPAAPAPPTAAAPAPAPAPTEKPAAAEPEKGDPATLGLLAEAEGALAKQSYVVAVDALLRAQHGGADAAHVQPIAAAVEKALLANIAQARKRKDRASEAEDRALLAKLRPLAPPAPAKRRATATARRR